MERGKYMGGKKTGYMRAVCVVLAAGLDQRQGSSCGWSRKGI